MIAATNMLRPPPARIGKISENIVLPRTIELRKALAAVGGGLFGVFAWLFPIGLISGYSVMSLLLTCTAFGGLGLLLVSWSPLRGESFSRWVGLSANTFRADRVRVDGQKVRAYIGVAPLSCTASGKVQIFSAAVDIIPGTHDERGVAVPTSEIRRAIIEASGVTPSAPSTLEGFEQLKDLSSPSGSRRSRSITIPLQPSERQVSPPPDAGSPYGHTTMQQPSWPPPGTTVVPQNSWPQHQFPSNNP